MNAEKNEKGLTIAEKKRIRELRYLLSGSGKKKEVPTTAQKTIPFQKMYQNGICQVTPTYYTKMVEFFDVNYELLDEEEQMELLQTYSEFINFFESGVKCQLFLFNRKVKEEVLMKQMELPMQQDIFDDIREEFSNILKLQMARGNFTDDLVKRLIGVDENISITFHLQTVDPVKAMKHLKGTLTNIQKMKINEQKKAVRNGYDMEIIPTDISTYEKNMLELLEDLNSSNQKIVKTTFLITCFGRSKRELESVIQRVSGIIQQANCNLRCLQYLQEQGLMASAPIGINDTGIERNLTTKSTAILIPFSTQELFMPSPALYYGLNAISNNMIFADRKKLRTPNGMILGTPGSGKSFSAKREILGCFLMTRDDIIIGDPEGEYFPLVQALHGQVVKLATNSKDYLTPMDIPISHVGDKEALRLKSDFIITLCDRIAGEKEGLTTGQLPTT